MTDVEDTHISLRSTEACDPETFGLWDSFWIQDPITHLTAQGGYADWGYSDPDEIGNRDVGKGVNFYSLEKEIGLGKQLAQEVEHWQEIQRKKAEEALRRAQDACGIRGWQFAVIDCPFTRRGENGIQDFHHRRSR
jgi:hypothetical protein